MRHDHELTHLRNYVVRWLSAFVTWCVTVFIFASDKASAPGQPVCLPQWHTYTHIHSFTLFLTHPLTHNMLYYNYYASSYLFIFTHSGTEIERKTPDQFLKNWWVYLSFYHHFLGKFMFSVSSSIHSLSFSFISFFPSFFLSLFLFLFQCNILSCVVPELLQANKFLTSSFWGECRETQHLKRHIVLIDTASRQHQHDLSITQDVSLCMLLVTVCTVLKSITD